MISLYIQSSEADLTDIAVVPSILLIRSNTGGTFVPNVALDF